MNIRYRVALRQDERDQLAALLSGGNHPARKIKRAQILLAAHAGVGDEAIAASVSVGASTIPMRAEYSVMAPNHPGTQEEPKFLGSFFQKRTDSFALGCVTARG